MSARRRYAGRLFRVGAITNMSATIFFFFSLEPFSLQNEIAQTIQVKKARKENGNKPP